MDLGLYIAASGMVAEQTRQDMALLDMVALAHGDPVVPLDQRNWGPGGPRPRSALVEPWTPSSSVGWRAYHKAMFPPGGLVTPWVRFKKMSTGVNVARRLWDQREDLREAYEAVHAE